MDEGIENKLYHAGKRLRHELTDLEIKLLSPNGKGWRAQIVSKSGEDYVVNMTNDDLMKRYRDVVEG
jgi:hypothetical protein